MPVKKNQTVEKENNKTESLKQTKKVIVKKTSEKNIESIGFDLNKTVFVKPKEIDKSRRWYKLDASGKVLGRLATEIAKRLIGKYKPYYCDFWDAGDFVVVVNADKIRFTGKKMDQKMYYRHSGYKGHLKEIPLSHMLDKNPEKVLYLAVRGMLPKNKLRKSRMKRLKIFVDNSNKFDYLSPEPIEING